MGGVGMVEALLTGVVLLVFDCTKMSGIYRQ